MEYSTEYSEEIQEGEEEEVKLDVGCGPHGLGDVNVDIQRFKQSNFIQADIHHLPFKSEVFNIIIAYAVFEHLASPCKGLGEIERCLAPDGRLIISVPNLWNWTRIGRWMKRGHGLIKVLSSKEAHHSDHKQGWDICVFHSVTWQTRMNIENVYFWNRYPNLDRKLFQKIIAKLLPSPLGKHEMKVVLRRSRSLTGKTPYEEFIFNDFKN